MTNALTMLETAIYFYSQRAVPYGCFSNFSPHGFTLDGLYWPTSEHYYQAQKFIGTPHYETVRLAPTPSAAAAIGRDRRRPLRGDWEQVKESAMLTALTAKFTTHADIRVVLLSTDERGLVEKSPVDYYWGCGQDGTGQNRLGQLLVELRATLRQQADTPSQMSTHADR